MPSLSEQKETSGPSAKIIADSISEQGHRLTTMEVVMHRFILAEMNTHRVFSRNSASSRAIPVGKIMGRVETNPAYPVHWGKEQKGMQSGDSFTDTEIEVLREDWRNASVEALNTAELLHKSGLHKSLVNRLLEPFMWHTAIITATEWDNFFWQRCDPAAQPEMKAVADRMQAAYFLSKPTLLVHGQWHLPYIKSRDNVDIIDVINEGDTARRIPSELEQMKTLKAVSTARCARVSYLTQDGIRDIREDIKLYERLKGSGHWSPFEHVATPYVPQGNYNAASDWSGNFNGWKQHRKEFHTENRLNFLPNLPELAQVRMRMEAGLNPWA